MTTPPMHLPTLAQAEAWLAEAEYLNPGAWVAHSRQVAAAAQSITAVLSGSTSVPATGYKLQATDSYIFGLLHDIGRREGIHGMRHILDGYNFLIAQGYPDAARICLTHSYPDQSLLQGADAWDGDTAGLQLVHNYIGSIEYNLYDRIIQLCDSLCMAHGPVLLEKRIVDVALRYGVNQHTLPRWRAILNVKNQIETLLGQSVYNLLPETWENSQ